MKWKYTLHYSFVKVSEQCGCTLSGPWKNDRSLRPVGTFIDWFDANLILSCLSFSRVGGSVFASRTSTSRTSARRTFRRATSPSGMRSSGYPFHALLGLNGLFQATPGLAISRSPVTSDQEVFFSQQIVSSTPKWGGKVLGSTLGKGITHCLSFDSQHHSESSEECHRWWLGGSVSEALFSECLTATCI